MSLMDFFRAPPSPSKASLLALQEARQALLQAVKNRQLPRLQGAYSNLMRRKELARCYHSPDMIDELSPDDMVSILQLLSSSSRLSDHSLLKKVMEDAGTTLPPEVQIAQRGAMLQSLINTQQQRAALAYLADLDSKGVEYNPNLWAILVSGFQEIGDMEGVHQTMAHYRSSKGKRIVEPYATYLEALFDAANSKGGTPDEEEISALLNEVESAGLEVTPLLWSKLLLGYMKCNMLEEAHRIDRLIEKEHKSDGSFSPANPENNPLWNAYIRFHRHVGSLAETQEMAKALKLHGFLPNEASISSWIQGAGSEASISELYEAEGCLGVQADSASWGLLVDVALRKEPSGVDEALTVYREALKSIPPTVPLIFNLIEYLCQPTQSHRTLNPPLEIYTELVTEEQNSKATTLSLHPLSTRLYTTLLHALGDSLSRVRRPKAGVIMSIIGDMKDRSLYLEDHDLRSLVPQLLSSVKSHEALMDMYRVIRSLNPAAFSAEVYAEVLRTAAFSSFPFPGARTIPFKLYFQIVQDMVDRGYPITMTVYQNLFQHYRGKLVVPVTHPVNSSILANIRGAHSLLRLDASVTPSSQLFNIIMDAYSRAGDFEAALSIWKNDLWSSRITDQRSISIILDSCGWHREKRLAFKIWSELRANEAKGRLSMDMKCWESWIECLCRLGCIEEAKRTVLEEMGSPQSRRQVEASNPPFANAVVVDTLLTFARGKSSAEQESLIVSIKQRLPDVYIEWTELSLRRKSKIPDALDSTRQSP
ncbi:hypothetical protein FRC03_004157 [Tulasnella sp. 419]|nr:hypothetical protein FRC03_004157 [Tulasnella sp. 419]